MYGFSAKLSISTLNILQLSLTFICFEDNYCSSLVVVDYVIISSYFNATVPTKHTQKQSNKNVFTMLNNTAKII